MKKMLTVAALIVATSVTAQPQQNSVGRPSARGLQAQAQAQHAQRLAMLGNLSTPVVVATTVTATVAASVIANANGDAKPEVPKTLKCEGTDPLVNNVCVRTTQVTTVTGTGTGTATTTVVVPVTSTYAPTLG